MFDINMQDLRSGYEKHRRSKLTLGVVSFSFLVVLFLLVLGAIKNVTAVQFLVNESASLVLFVICISSLVDGIYDFKDSQLLNTAYRFINGDAKVAVTDEALHTVRADGSSGVVLAKPGSAITMVKQADKVQLSFEDTGITLLVVVESVGGFYMFLRDAGFQVVHETE